MKTKHIYAIRFYVRAQLGFDLAHWRDFFSFFVGSSVRLEPFFEEQTLAARTRAGTDPRTIVRHPRGREIARANRGPADRFARERLRNPIQLPAARP